MSEPALEVCAYSHVLSADESLCPVCHQNDARGEMCPSCAEDYDRERRSIWNAVQWAAKRSRRFAIKQRQEKRGAAKGRKAPECMAALLAETPPGRCLFCDEPLTGIKRIMCGDAGCRADYFRTYRRAHP